MDSFVGLFDGFYYILTGESTSKADNFDNFCSMKMSNTLLKNDLGSVQRDKFRIFFVVMHPHS